MSHFAPFQCPYLRILIIFRTLWPCSCEITHFACLIHISEIKTFACAKVNACEFFHFARVIHIGKFGLFPCAISEINTFACAKVYVCEFFRFARVIHIGEIGSSACAKGYTCEFFNFASVVCRVRNALFRTCCLMLMLNTCISQQYSFMHGALWHQDVLLTVNVPSFIAHRYFHRGQGGGITQNGRRP